MIIIDKQLLAPVPFVVSGATIKVKGLLGDDLVVLPYTPEAILERSSEAIEFKYILDEVVLFTNYLNDADADADYAALTDLLEDMASGIGGATAANQVLEIAELTAIKGNQTNGTQVTTVSSSALPTGASTAANQTTGNSTLAIIATNTTFRGNVTDTLVPVTTTSAVVLVANSMRKSLLIWNNSGGFIRIGIGTTSLPNSGMRIPPNNGYSFDFIPTQDIHIRTEAGVNNVNLIWS